MVKSGEDRKGGDEDGDERKKRKREEREGGGKKRLTRSDRSVNLGRKGRVGQIDLVRLVADITLNFGDIRSDLYGDVGDCVDGGVGRIG